VSCKYIILIIFIIIISSSNYDSVFIFYQIQKNLSYCLLEYLVKLHILTEKDGSIQ